MLIALTKLADIAARSLFVLFVLYALPVRGTGQFGLSLTLLGFYAFTVGFERYNDIQRRLVNVDACQADRLILSTLRFFLLNHLMGLPVLGAVLWWWVGLPGKVVALLGLVAVAEHLCNEVYRIALIVPRYRPLMFAVLTKNLALLAGTGLFWWLWRPHFDLGTVVELWALASMLVLLGLAAGFMRLWSFTPGDRARSAELSARTQFHASRTHFLIGLVAMGTLQIDRLLVGGLLSLDDTGNFFRHAFLAAFAYQVFNVASYNRLAPAVYSDCLAGRPAQAKARIRREYGRLLPAAAVVVAAFYLVKISPLGELSTLRSISPHLLTLMTAGYLVRTVADFHALLMNAVHAERFVFRAQWLALATAILVNLALTPTLGLFGPALSLLASAAVYALANRRFQRRIAPLKPLATHDHSPA